MNPVEEYISIIHYRQQNQLTESGELHHIIPKSCGGAKRAKWNLVRLTSEEHIECHRLLTKIYPTGEEHRAMCAAYALMCNTRDGIKLSDKQAAEARQAASHVRKGKPSPYKGKSRPEMKGRIPWNKGISTGGGWHWSEESKKKQSLAKKGKQTWMKGRHHTEEAKQKLREAHLGTHASEETRAKMREARRLREDRKRRVA